MNKLDSKKIFAAYSGSTFCRDYSEIDDFHGYLLWNIEENTVEEIEVENDYGFSTVSVNQFTDFDNLDLEIENPKKFNRVKIIWNGYSSQRNTENKEKVKKYLESKYKIIELKEKKNFINEEKFDVANTNDIKIENISKKEGQQKLFVEYLESIGYEKDFIDEIIQLDDEISKKLDDEFQEPVIWKPLILRSENFKSFEKFELDFRDLKGVLQITGDNQVGKTTAYSLISYIAYNSTLETEKIQKNGDNRFINNKLNKDYCWGEMVFEADNNYYGIRRYTTRKWNRDKTEISGVSTTLNYYKLATPDEPFSDTNIIDVLNDQVKKKTQNVIDSIINNYSNFKKLALTTSDTLNEVLKVDKAEFIDSLLFNLGMDFFDKKLSEIKEYKNTYFKNHPKINLSVENTQNKIKSIEDNIKNKLLSIKENNDSILKITEQKNNLSNESNLLINKLNKIDSELLKIDVNILNNQISTNNQKLEEKRSAYVLNNKKIATLEKSYDDSDLVLLNESYQQRKNEILKHKERINEIKLQISNTDNNISKNKTDIYYVNKENDSLNKEIETLEKSTTCSMCGQGLKDEPLEKIRLKIKEKQSLLNENKKSIKVFEKNILALENEKEKQKESIKSVEDEINVINVSNEELLVKISEEENKKNSYNLRKELTLKNENIKIEGENIKLVIENLNNKIKLYDNNQKYIVENKEINDKISVINQKVNILNDDIVSLQRTNSQFETDNKYYKEQIENEQTLIKKYEKQVKKENLFSVYENCVHRNGIPTLMLKKYSLPTINKMLNDLLKEVPFDVYLDEETLRLKMVDINNSKIAIDCISGSGKERTFSSIALKYCLNELNIKSKPEILILDEVTGKLIGKSITEFVDMLELLKTKMNNIIIIEHVHNLKPDHVIKIVKDTKGISSIAQIV